MRNCYSDLTANTATTKEDREGSRKKQRKERQL